MCIRDRGGIDAAGIRRALPRNAERVDTVDKDGWRTNKPSLLRLLLTGNHGRTDRLRRRADPIESQAQHRQGDRFVRTVRHDKKLHIHSAHPAPAEPHRKHGFAGAKARIDERTTRFRLLRATHAVDYTPDLGWQVRLAARSRSGEPTRG